jgi:hypothetical protein
VLHIDERARWNGNRDDGRIGQLTGDASDPALIREP